jgi:hypothetical protein
MNKIRTLILCFDVNNFGWKKKIALEYTHGNKKLSQKKGTIMDLITYVEIPQDTLRRESHTTTIETPN